MNDEKYFLDFTKVDPTKMPETYAIDSFINLIKNTIEEVLGFSMRHYECEENIFEILKSEISDPKANIRFLGRVTQYGNDYYCSKKDGAYSVVPDANNCVYHYPDFEVVLFNCHMFYSDGSITYSGICASNHQAVEQFLDYLNEKKRDSEHISIFIDTNVGLKKTKQKVKETIQREDVILEENMKNQIFRSIDQFFNESGSFFKKYGLQYRRGILLYGDPGNGKTTLVKSIAGSISAPVIYWQITEYTNSDSVVEIFDYAAFVAPAVLVIEDMDSMPEEVRSIFLNILDGVSTKEGIFLIGTTNYPEKIDPALMNRAGRFDRAYEIKPPTEAMRWQVLKNKKIDFVTEEEIKRIGTLTEGFSVVQLNELYTMMALEWHYENCVDYKKIIDEMKTGNFKQKKQKWHDSSTSVGFR